MLLRGYKDASEGSAVLLQGYKDASEGSEELLQAYMGAAEHSADKNINNNLTKSSNYGKQESINKLSDSPVGGELRWHWGRVGN